MSEIVLPNRTIVVMPDRAADLAALALWHALFGWPALRELSRGPDPRAAFASAYDKSSSDRDRRSTVLVAVGRREAARCG